MAGNVFVHCDKGVRVLNSADVRVYNNTFIDTPASFERNERSATGDHFGWHPSTGPNVDEREGHVFVNNLLVASQSYRLPLLRFEQPQTLCSRLTRPMAKQIDGNLYVRPSIPDVEAGPLVTWSPAPSDNCSSSFTTLDEFKKMAYGFEANGHQLDRTPRSALKGSDLGRYDLQPISGVGNRHVQLPADVRKLLGWTEQEAQWPGAYPLRN